MDFPVAEYEMRLERAQAAMRVAKLDALMFTTEPEIRYFTGFRTQFWQSPTRPWFLIVPKTGGPIAIIPEIGTALMEKTWVHDIRSWASPHADDDGVSLLVDALRGNDRIGMPMGRESQLRMPLSDFDRLRDRLSASAFLDASALVQHLRFVKSEAEIALHARICGLACDAFDQAPKLFHEGQPLEESFRRFKLELLQQGAEDVPYLVGGAGPLGYDDVISPPDETPLQAGDVLMLDTGASLRGAFCDFDRNFAIGHADERVRRAHETLWQATEAGLNAARPGVTCSQVFEAMQSVIDAHGGPQSGSVGRLGHGLGLQLTEAPSIIGFDHTILCEGAVMTLEPSMMVPGGDMLVHEENIVVRDGVPQLLTRRAARELPVI